MVPRWREGEKRSIPESLYVDRYVFPETTTAIEVAIESFNPPMSRTWHLAAVCSVMHNNVCAFILKLSQVASAENINLGLLGRSSGHDKHARSP